LDGYGFLMCSSSHVLSVVVDSRPSDLGRTPDDVRASPLDDVTLKLHTQQQQQLRYTGLLIVNSIRHSGPTYSQPLYFPISSANVLQSKRFLAYMFFSYPLTRPTRMAHHC